MSLAERHSALDVRSEWFLMVCGAGAQIRGLHHLLNLSHLLEGDESHSVLHIRPYGHARHVRRIHLPEGGTALRLIFLASRRLNLFF